jgi:hypothetical protein
LNQAIVNTQTLDFIKTYASLARCRGGKSSPGMETERDMLRAMGLSDEQIYARWTVEGDWIAFNDSPECFVEMIIDKPLWCGLGDIRHLLIEAVESNTEWNKTYLAGLEDIDQCREPDLQANPVAMAVVKNLAAMLD